MINTTILIIMMLYIAMAYTFLNDKLPEESKSKELIAFGIVGICFSILYRFFLSNADINASIKITNVVILMAIYFLVRILFIKKEDTNIIENEAEPEEIKVEHRWKTLPSASKLIVIMFIISLVVLIIII